MSLSGDLDYGYTNISNIWIKRAFWLIKNNRDKYGKANYFDLAFKIRNRCVSAGTEVFYRHGEIVPYKDPFEDNIAFDKQAYGEDVENYYPKSKNIEVFKLERDGRFNIKVFHSLFQNIALNNPVKGDAKMEYATGSEGNIFDDPTISSDFKVVVKGYFGDGIQKEKTVTVKKILEPLQKELKAFYKDLKSKGTIVNGSVDNNLNVEIIRPHVSTSIWLRFTLGNNIKKSRKSYLCHLGHIYLAYVSDIPGIDPYVLMELNERIKKVMLEKIVNRFEL